MDNSELHERAVRRGGILTRADLDAAGLSSGGVQRALQAGRIAVVRYGAYTTPEFLTSVASERWKRHALDVRAALAAAGGDAVASGPSSAALHGIDMFGPVPTMPIVVRPSFLNGHGRLSRTTRARVARLPDSHLTLVGGWRATTLARSLVDIARWRDEKVVVVAGDSALRAGMDPVDLDRALADCARSPGIRRARRNLPFCDARAESPLESLTRLALMRGGFAVPDLQYQIGPYRVDFCWPAQRIVLEVDGKLKYQDQDDLFAEKRREDWIRREGYTFHRAVWDDVIPRPDALYDRLQASLRLAA